MPTLALVLAVLALACALAALRFSIAGPPRRGADLDGVPEDLPGLRREVAALRSGSGSALRRTGVVRYDAFGDMGGHVSWSLALLDDGGHGIVLTSIHARSEARTYAKAVTAWSSEQQLSPEEESAIGQARG